MARQDKILAAAFTDVNGDNKFDASKGDVLIAALIDTNHDRTVSIGDTVQFGTYPENTAGTSTANFNHVDSLVIAVNQNNFSPLFTQVTVAEGDVTWQIEYLPVETPGPRPIPIRDLTKSAETFATENTGGTQESLFKDQFFTSPTNPQPDQVVINMDSGVNGPGTPTSEMSIAEMTPQPGDQPFLDVFIA